MADVIEIDYTTDPPTETEREFTPEERAQREADLADEAAREQAAAEAVAARDAAIAHAKSLGFTDAMIAVMYPGLAG